MIWGKWGREGMLIEWIVKIFFYRKKGRLFGKEVWGYFLLLFIVVVVLGWVSLVGKCLFKIGNKFSDFFKNFKVGEIRIFF